MGADDRLLPSKKRAQTIGFPRSGGVTNIIDKCSLNNVLRMLHGRRDGPEGLVLIINWVVNEWWIKIM